MPEVIIRNPKTGEEVAIDTSNFRRGKAYRDPKSGDMMSFADAGFEIVSMPNGEPYTGPLNDPPAERASPEPKG